MDELGAVFEDEVGWAVVADIARHGEAGVFGKGHAVVVCQGQGAERCSAQGEACHVGSIGLAIAGNGLQGILMSHIVGNAIQGVGVSRKVGGHSGGVVIQVVEEGIVGDAGTNEHDIIRLRPNARGGIVRII